jgi:hypothetical protein
MIHNARMTSRIDGDFVVFLIGMRINQPWALHKWLSVLRSMPRMIRELQTQPELGFLGAENWVGRTTIMLQYWRSLDALLAYAKARDAEHLPAWRAFNQRIGTDGSVGIWHETYCVHAGGHENVYVNMPPFGLGRIGQLVEAGGTLASASGRMHGDPA